MAVCLQDKAPEIKSEATEDISQEDWISIKESLALASERDELEKIKEDREEFQEVRLSQRKSLLPFFLPRFSPVEWGLRTVPTIVNAHTFCASLGTRISYRQCLLLIFFRGLKLSGERRS